jgi:DNA-binding NarL/FixJ family response regulator
VITNPDDLRIARIGIVHSDGLYRESLGHYLSQADGLSIVLSASRVDDARDAMFACQPDLLLLQFDISRCHAGDGAGGIRAFGPELKTIVIGVPDTDEAILSCIEGGGAGYVGGCVTG